MPKTIPFFVSLLVFVQVTVASGQETEPLAEDENAPSAEQPETTSEQPELPPGQPAPEDRKIFQIGARLHAGWDLDHTTQSSTTVDDAGVEQTSTEEVNDNEFYIKRARIKFEFFPVRWLLGVVKIEATEVVDGTLLKDAYIHLSPVRQLQVRIGQFKKPFSAMELRSPSKRRLINRGPGNDLIIEDLMFGGRDLGIQLSGRLVKSIRLEYAIGAFNGSGPNLGDPGRSKDLTARLQIRPHKRLELGTNGSFKFFDDSEQQARKPSWAWAAGLDLRLKVKGLRLSLEGLAGQNHLAYLEATDSSSITADNPPEFFGVLAEISYKHDFMVSWGFAIEPAFKAEFLEPTTVFTSDEVLAFTPGINTYLGKYFRLMINGEFIRSRRNSSADFPDREILMVLACLDI